MACKNDLKCGTLNVRGLNNTNKRNKVFKWLESTLLNIIFLQETYCTESVKPCFNSGWKGKIYHSCSDSKHSRGVCIMFSQRLNVEIKNVHQCQDGRRIMVNCIIDEVGMTFVCVYAPNDVKSRKAFMNRTKMWIKKYAEYKSDIICAGDYNCCLDEYDRTSKTHLKDKSRECMSSLITELDLIDTWNVTNDKTGYTYVDKQHGVKSRLDYILLSKHSNLEVNKCVISVCSFVPDHACVITTVSNHANHRGNGYWKMNGSLLEDVVYVSQITNVINETRKSYANCSKQTVWEMIKINVKDVSVRYSIKKAKNMKNNKKMLQERLDHLYECTDTNMANDACEQERKDVEKKLDELYTNELRGAQIRSRVRWFDEAERCSKFFLSLENVHQQRNNIVRLKDNGNIVSDDIGILSVCSTFYKELYSSECVDDMLIKEYIMNTGVPMLDQVDKEQCDMPITKQEVQNAIGNLKLNKSPGPDGIIPEFYKKFWDCLKDPFMDMVHESEVKGEMPNSMCQSILSLMYKKGDKDEIKNYRPVSLSNYDYKLIAFVLAKRLQCVIKKLIHENQSGYVKGRFIGVNNRIVQDILEYCEKKNIPGAIVCLDFEKAYDKLEWNFMFEALSQYNFGNHFIQMIRMLYTNPNFVVKNNGWLSEKVEMHRGIRQGCPVSSLLFILALEIMSIRIRSNNDISGFMFDQIEHKLSQYADDSTLMLSTIESIEEVYLS